MSFYSELCLRVNKQLLYDVCNDEFAKIYQEINIPISDQDIKEIINLDRYSNEKSLFKIAHNTINFELKQDYLDYAIGDNVYYCNINNIKYLLDNGLKVTKDIFRKVITMKLYNICNREKIVKLILNFGYILDYQDFLDLTSIKFELDIDTFKNYDFQIDDDFFERCSNSNFYPTYYDISKIKDKNKILNTYFTKQIVYLHEIRDFISKTDAKPDITSLELVCKKGVDNHQVLNFLLKECNIKPNITCLENMFKKTRNLQKSLKQLFNEFCENNTITYSPKIKEIKPVEIKTEPKIKQQVLKKNNTIVVKKKK